MVKLSLLKHIHSSGGQSRLVHAETLMSKPQQLREYHPMWFQQQRQRWMWIVRMKNQRGIKHRCTETAKTETASATTALTRTSLQIHRRRYDQERMRIG